MCCVRYRFSQLSQQIPQCAAGPGCLPDNDKMDRPVALVTSYFCPFRAPLEAPLAFLVTSPSCAPSSPGERALSGPGRGEGEGAEG